MKFGIVLRLPGYACFMLTNNGLRATAEANLEPTETSRIRCYSLAFPWASIG